MQNESSETESFLSEKWEDYEKNQVKGIQCEKGRAHKIHLLVLYTSNAALLIALIWRLMIEPKSSVHEFYCRYL